MTFLSAPIVDVQTGIMATVLPPFTPPVFLRLMRATGGAVDQARQVYLQAANADLRACTAGWRDGAGVLVSAAPPDLAALTAEIHEIGRVLRALAEPSVANGYLELMTSSARAGDDSGANPAKGE
jgi:hypothetical protein